MTSEAIVIGVNNYEFLQPLKYAQQDALAVKQFLENEARFDRVYYFAEDAPAVNGMSMRPTRNNLRQVMRKTFKNPFMGDGDNFWFFFSGHGMRSGGRDFLMPIDGDPDDVAESGISTAQVSEWLRGCGADNVVMVLDACRSGGMKDGKGIGDETREGCRQTGVISLFSCYPNQFSYELEAYQQGAFTKVLLEGLGVQGGGATVARLDEYLKRRVPEIVRDCLGDWVSQVPYLIAEPINRSHLILMPQHSRPEDLNALKMDAFRAQNANDLRLAYQCWLRVNIASGGLDMEAIGEIVKLYPQMPGFKTPPIDQSPIIFPFTKGDLEGSELTEKPIASNKAGFTSIQMKTQILSQQGIELRNRALSLLPKDIYDSQSELWDDVFSGDLNIRTINRILSNMPVRTRTLYKFFLGLGEYLEGDFGFNETIHCTSNLDQSIQSDSKFQTMEQAMEVSESLLKTRQRIREIELKALETIASKYWEDYSE